MVGKSFTAGEDIFDLKKKRGFRIIIGKYFKDILIDHYKARSFIKIAEKPTFWNQELYVRLNTNCY